MDYERSELIVCGRPLQQFLDDIEKFHGFTAPGLVIGGFMVDLAQKKIEPGIEADAVVETGSCLPDAIQIFTPCTTGNGWMKVVKWDKFALSLYNKKTFSGVRVWLDLEKAKQFPNVYNWFMHLVPKKELPLEVLLDSIIEAGDGILSWCEIQVKPEMFKGKKRELGICPACHESFSRIQGEVCTSCRGDGYFDFQGLEAV